MRNNAGFYDNKKIKLPKIKKETFSNNSPVETDINGETSTGFSPLNIKQNKGHTFSDKPLEAFNVSIDDKGNETINKGITNKTGSPIRIPGRTLKQDTNFSPITKEREKIAKDYNKTVDETHKNYILAKGDYNTKKDYYTNFDEVNKTFDDVIGDIRDAQKLKGADLDSADYQTIARKYGLDEKDITNPKNILNSLKLTEGGKQKFGVNKFEEGLSDNEKRFNRQKEDMALRLKNAKTDTNTEIDRIRKQVEDNINTATKQGVWNGAMKSSGYIQGLQNIKDDGNEIINKLEKSLNRMESADEENIGRMTEDYNLAVKRAGEQLDSQMQKIKFNAGLELNGLTEKFGVGSDALTTALDGIEEKFATMDSQAVSRYLQNVRNVQNITRENLSQYEKAQNLADFKNNQRFNEYLSNDGVLLQNTSLSNLMQEVNAGNLSTKKYTDLKNYMTTGVVNILGKYGRLDQADLTEIDTLLGEGKTPAEIVAKMRENEKFQETQVKQVSKTVDLGDTKRVYYNDGTYDDLKIGRGDKTVDSVVKVGDNKSKVYFSDGTSEILSDNKVEGGNVSGNTTGAVAVSNNPNSIISFSERQRGKTNLQCGELVNDYIKKETGVKGGMGNSIASKEAYIKRIGESQVPVTGGVFAWDLGTEYGHTGIVQNVNADGSIDVLEANRKGSTNGGKAKTGRYTAEQVKKMTFSNPIGKTTSTQGQGVSELENNKVKNLAVNVVNGIEKLSSIKDKELYNEVSNYIVKNDLKKGNANDNEISSLGQAIMRGEQKMSTLTGADNAVIRRQIMNYMANNDVVLKEDDMQVTDAREKLALMKELVDWKEGGTPWYGNDTTNESLIENISGDITSSLIDGALTNQNKQVLSKIKYILDGEVLQNLIDIKKAGGTFGALSDKELGMLTSSASYLNSASKRNKENGEILGFPGVSEKDMKKNLRNMIKGYEIFLEKSLKSTNDTEGVKQDVETDPLGLGIETENKDPLNLGL